MKDVTVRNTRAIVRLAIGLGTAGPLLLFGAPGVAADPAIDGPADGTYLLTKTGGQKETWTITSCGPRCLTVISDSGWTSKSGPDPRYHQGDWYVQGVVGTAICPDGTTINVGSQTYTFNAETLTGTIRVHQWTGCADHGGGDDVPPDTTFTMSKT